MGNNPILHNDENGDIFGVDNLIGATIGAAIETGTQMAVNAATGKDVFELDYADIAVEAAVGFATSGVGNIAKSGKTLQRITKAANNISKAANSNKAIKTVVKATKATGAGKNVIKASFDVKLKDGKLKNESKTKSGSEIAVDIVGGIVGDGFGNVVNDAVAAKVTKQITRQTNKSHKAISKEVANKYAKKVTGSRAKAAAIKAPGSLSFNVQAGTVGDAVKKKISNNNPKKH